jgi:CRISPR-associated protein (TIGR03986 family)
LLSQQTVDGKPPRLETNLPEDEAERAFYSRGILRVLGVPGRDDAIPRTKKHELFIPYLEDIETQPTFPIVPDAIPRFYQLADERTDASKEAPFLPYEPCGTVRNRTPDGTDDQRFRLKDGDLVYFQPDTTGTAVSEISLSAIWRREAGGSSYTYFKQLSPELLPFHSKRQSISLAEQVLGFVEQRQGRDDLEQDSAAIASRLRFSFGHLHPDPGAPYYEERVLLKILDTPKPPAPAFYFKTRHGRGSYIAKDGLNPDNHVPQGRKFYLHRPQRSTRPWKTSEETENLKQKSYVTPIKPELSFYFHIDFDNLSASELGLLCYAIRPSEAFRHKLGMGKSIGLGKVRLDPVGIFYVDRQDRYQETSILEADRYQQIWMAMEEKSDDWPNIYARERKEAANKSVPGMSFDELREGFAKTIDPDIKQALALLGNPQMVPASARVHTPQVESAAQPWEMEQETYRWFVENEREGHQFLKPLNADTKELPSLER